MPVPSKVDKLLENLLGQLVPSFPSRRVQENLIGSLYYSKFCCCVWIVRLLVWMFGEGQFPESLRVHCIKVVN